MGSGYVENGEERLGHLNNLLVKHEKCGAGRGVGDKQIPDFLRSMIGITAKFSGSPAAAKAFDVSQPTANTASHGKRSPNGPVIPEVKGPIDETIANARSKAVDAVMSALDILPDKIDSSLKAKDLALIARDISTVVSKLAPADEKAARGAQVIFYMPKERDVKDYEVLEVEAREVE